MSTATICACVVSASTIDGAPVPLPISRICEQGPRFGTSSRALRVLLSEPGPCLGSRSKSSKNNASDRLFSINFLSLVLSDRIGETHVDKTTLHSFLGSRSDSLTVPFQKLQDSS